MSVEVKPLDNACNLLCDYCYQNGMRDAGNTRTSTTYDLDKIKAAIEREWAGHDINKGRHGFTVFGGEPLLMPFVDLAELFRWGYEKFGANNIQTNATLITDEHIVLFKEFHVHVGISMDGPGELNDSRWAGSLERTRELSAKSNAALRRLLAEHLGPSLIVTLYRGNAVGEHLSKLVVWLKGLEAAGLAYARVHALEIDHASVQAMGLTNDEQIAAFRCLSTAGLTTLKLDIFEDMRKLLAVSDEDVTCVWNACDPYTTHAVQGIDGQGHKQNCGRTNKDGVQWLKADTAGYERYMALYHTPQEVGGCKGCRFFVACKGQCPGTAIDGDWRNRTRDCRVWFTLFEDAERTLLLDGQMPISLDTARRTATEQRLFAAWASGNPGHLLEDRPHGDIPHGDIPHGDHNDEALVHAAG